MAHLAFGRVAGLGQGGEGGENEVRESFYLLFVAGPDALADLVHHGRDLLGGHGENVKFSSRGPIRLCEAVS